MKKQIRNDVILISSLLLLVAIAGLSMILFRTVGNTVTITVDGKPFGVYPLTVDREIEIRNGDGYNRLVIENGKAYVSAASCPDGICASHKPIEYNGQAIICLPNKVVIEIHTTDRNQPDIIT